LGPLGVMSRNARSEDIESAFHRKPDIARCGGKVRSGPTTDRLDGRIPREHFINGKTIREISRDLKVSRNTVRKLLRSGETSFEYERDVQPSSTPPTPRVARKEHSVRWPIKSKRTSPLTKCSAQTASAGMLDNRPLWVLLWRLVPVVASKSRMSQREIRGQVPGYRGFSIGLTGSRASFRGPSRAVIIRPRRPTLAVSVERAVSVAPRPAELLAE
jgi:hypothetical protein